jgi:hypothetical protein
LRSACAIAPFIIDEQIIGVIHVDLTQIDVDALGAVEGGPLEKMAVEDLQREGRGWLADLTKVVGGQPRRSNRSPER